MKRLYTLLIVLTCMSSMQAQDKIYVHKSNGSIDAFALSQLDSLSFITTSENLQLTADKDTIRVGEIMSLQTNILDGSMMDVAWGTRENTTISVSGLYTRGTAEGLLPGQAMVAATCDGQVATYPLTVIGRATSTGAPKVDWTVNTIDVRSGDSVAFTAQYDSKKHPVDYTAVWYDVVKMEQRMATCHLIKAINYVYTNNQATQTVQSLAERHRYTHDTTTWNSTTLSYVNKDNFTLKLPDTVGTIIWDTPRDTVGFALKIKTYYGENFPSEFKNGVAEKLNPTTEDRHYNGYMQLFSALGLLQDSVTIYNGEKMPYLQWMTDSTFNANTNAWEKHFKQYDTIWSTVNFDTLSVRVDSTPIVKGRPPRQDTIGWEYDTIYTTKPWFVGATYVYPEIKKRIDQAWNEEVSYLDLLLGPDGYGLNYRADYQVNAEYRVYDKKGNFDKTPSHTIVVENQVEKIKVIAPQPIVARETPVKLQIGKYYTDRQGTKEFTWIFPQDTRSADTYDHIHTLSNCETTPELIFSHVGSLPITLQITINGVRLPDELVYVNVGYNEEAPTLYYATAQGNIMAHKLIKNAPQDMKIYSYDLGFYTQHAFNLLFKDSLLYVLDAGKQFYYVNDVNNNLGDGKISVLSKDGKTVETMISNVGQQAFNDPFYGFIDGDHLYYSNRNTGIVKLPLSARNQVYNTSDHPWYVQNNTLGYYNNGWAYSAIGGVFGKINGIWHWTKFYNGYGIYRFEDSDILPAAITKGDETNEPKAGIMLDGMWPKSFVYAAKSATPKMLVHIMDAGYNGIYAATYDEFNAVGSSKNRMIPYVVTYNGMIFKSNTADNLPAKEGMGTESIGITQMAYDEINDCVYFAYRNNAPGDAYKFPASGIYSYNVTTGEVTCLIEGVEAYGITVNNTPSKLF